MKRIRNDTYFDLLDTKTMRCMGTAIIQAEPVQCQTGMQMVVKYLCEVRLDAPTATVINNENV